MRGWGNMSLIYVASSWRNPDQPYIIEFLRKHGYKVYDFRHPEINDIGFHWSEIDPDWESWTKYTYRDYLAHTYAVNGFKKDIAAMKQADIFIGIQPFGKSASFEMGWAAGQGKKTILLLANGEPELMVKMFDHICCNLNEVLKALKV